MLKQYSLVVFLTTIFIASCTGQVVAESHRLFGALLIDHVYSGLVDYKTLRQDKRLKQYCAQLARTDPDTITSEKARLAFWINAYNAYTLKIICDNYPVKSINDLHKGGLIVGTALKTTVWDKELVIINGKRTTLNTIEHKMIRPIFHDPRVHFVLVCASKSCPALRTDAYEGEKLDKQLDDQGRIFLADPFRNSFDLEKKQASLSKIFSWYSEDFGGTDEKIMLFITRFLPKELADSIIHHPKSWKIEYKEYNWAINDTQ